MIKNVAFDFDGVNHIDVTQTDENGIRHPIMGLDNIPNTPFKKIINLIEYYYKNNYNIFIITARTIEYKDIIIKTLQKFNLLNMISNKNIYFTGNNINGDKINVLEELKI